MQIFGPSAIAAHAQATSGTADTGASGAGSITSSADKLTNEDTFLKLLVAQIQNQDPMNPTDSIQFVGQLVQYSELEQLIGIKNGVQTLVGTSAQPPATSDNTANSSTGATQ